MTSAVLSLEHPHHAAPAPHRAGPVVLRAPANEWTLPVLSDFARAMRQVEQEVYGID
jgi:hypothetical protein